MMAPIQPLTNSGANLLRHLRATADELIPMGGHMPLWLVGEDVVWVVSSGQVNVFSVQLRASKLVGPRRYLLRATTGQALFGLGVEGETEPRLFAVGKADTQLIRVRWGDLQVLAQDSVWADQVARMIDGWIDSSSIGIARRAASQMPPDRCAFWTCGQAHLREGDAARPRSEVLWVRRAAHEAADGVAPLRLMGLDQAPSIPDDSFFPLSKYAWVQAIGEIRVSLIDTRAYLAREPTLNGLERFHRLALAAIALGDQQTVQVETERVRAEAAFNRATITGALSQLAGVLEPTIERQAGLVGESALLAACRLVGQASGISFRAPPGGQARQPNSGTVAAYVAESARIASASGVRWRRVSLKEGWQRQDSGPLLAYLDIEEEGQVRPVALLPASPGRYVLHDPVAGSRTPVTADVAARLAIQALVFYRPFPERALNVWDVLRFGLWGSKRDLLTLLWAGAAGGLLALILPLAIGFLFDHVIPTGDLGQLAQLGLALFVSALATVAFEITRSVAILRLEGKMDALIQAAVWDRLLRLPMTFFRGYSAGDLAYRAAGIDAIRQLLAGVTITALISAIFSIFSFGLLFSYNVGLALTATAIIVAVFLVTSLTSLLQLRYQRELLEMEGRLASHVLQWLTGITKLRVAGAEARAFGLWGRAFARQKRLAFRARRVGNGLAVFNAAYPLLADVLLFAALSFSDRVWSAGDFLAFYAAFTQCLVAVLAVNGVITSMLRAIPTFERVQPILEAQPEVRAGKAHPGRLSGAIEVSHVSFRYPNSETARASAKVLDDVSLNVRPGEFVAIVGPSGAGKSTLFRLLLGFERPESGSIYYDHQDLAGLDPQAVRRQIGVVLQDGKLMPGSILENIVGSSGMTLDDAWQAARAAGLGREIEQLPMGMHTVVTEDGRTFSGGQRQRLLIARAIVSHPRILFLDEATNELDGVNQEQITASLADLQATRLVIAHRLSTIVHADSIHVIVGGCIVQRGTFDELVRQPGPFDDLARRQLV